MFSVDLEGVNLRKSNRDMQGQEENDAKRKLATMQVEFFHKNSLNNSVGKKGFSEGLHHNGKNVESFNRADLDDYQDGKTPKKSSYGKRQYVTGQRVSFEPKSSPMSPAQIRSQQTRKSLELIELRAKQLKFLTKYSKEKELWNKTNKTLKETIEDLKHQVSVQDEIISKLKDPKDNEKIQNEIDDLKKQNEQLKKELEEKKDEIRSQDQRNLKSVQHEYEILLNKLHEEKEELKSVHENEQKEMIDLLNKMKEQNEKLTEKIKIKNEQLNVIQEREESLERERDSLKNQISALQENNKELNESYQSKISSLNEKISQLGENQKQIQSNEVLEQEIEKLMKEEIQLRKEFSSHLQDKEEEIRKLKMYIKNHANSRNANDDSIELQIELNEALSELRQLCSAMEQTKKGGQPDLNTILNESIHDTSSSRDCSHLIKIQIEKLKSMMIDNYTENLNLGNNCTVD